MSQLHKRCLLRVTFYNRVLLQQVHTCLLHQAQWTWVSMHEPICKPSLRNSRLYRPLPRCQKQQQSPKLLRSQKLLQQLLCKQTKMLVSLSYQHSQQIPPPPKSSQ